MDNERVEYFFKKYYRKCVYVAWKWGANYHEAQDIAVEMFCKLIEREDIYTEKQIGSFLITGSIRKTTDLTRSKQRHSKDHAKISVYQSEGEDPSNLNKIPPTAEIEAIFAMYDAIERLPIGQKEPIKLWLMGYSTHETAVTLNKSPQTILNQHTRALKNLRQMILPRFTSPFR